MSTDICGGGGGGGGAGAVGGRTAFFAVALVVIIFLILLLSITIVLSIYLYSGSKRPVSSSKYVSYCADATFSLNILFIISIICLTYFVSSPKRLTPNSSFNHLIMDLFSGPSLCKLSSTLTNCSGSFILFNWYTTLTSLVPSPET